MRRTRIKPSTILQRTITTITGCVREKPIFLKNWFNKNILFFTRKYLQLTFCGFIIISTSIFLLFFNFCSHHFFYCIFKFLTLRNIVCLKQSQKACQLPVMCYQTHNIIKDFKYHKRTLSISYLALIHAVQLQKGYSILIFLCPNDHSVFFSLYSFCLILLSPRPLFLLSRFWIINTSSLFNAS